MNGRRPVDLLVRLEWTAVAILCFLLYPLTSQSWWWFLVLILAPDLSIVGYFAGPRVGAWLYNAFHVLFWPVGLIGFGVWRLDPWILSLGLIWLTHIAIDRSLGYGLKLPSGFRHTHLGRIGGDPGQ